MSDALLSRHLHYDVICAYRSSLADKVKRSRLQKINAKALRQMSKFGVDYDAPSNNFEEKGLRSDGTKITDRDRLYARIAKLQSAIELAKSNLETDSDEAGSSYEQLMTEEEKDFQDLYDRWQSTLQRPAYYEDVSAAVRAQAESSSFKKEETNGTENTATKGQAVVLFEKISDAAKAAIGSISQNYLPVIVPIESYFTYPAFDVLTPGNIPAAIAGCLMFTFALAGSGILAAICFRRSFRHTLDSSPSPDGKYPIQTTASKGWLAFFTFTMIGIGFLVVGGADLRAKIPIMSDWLTEGHSIQDDQKKIISDVENGADPSDLRTDKSAYQAELASHLAEREKTLTFGSQTLHSDELVAFGVYLFLVLLGGMRILASADPYLEYQLLANWMNKIKLSRLRLAAQKDASKNWATATINSAKQELNDIRTKLWLIAPDDELALSPTVEKDGVTKPATASKPQTSETEAKNDSGISDHDDALDDFGEIWIRERLRNYVRAFTFFRGASLAAKWPGSLKKAMS